MLSLDDDEIAKIKSFMDGAGSNGSSAPAPPAPGKAKPASPPAPTRDMSPVRKGPLRDLDSIKKRNKSSKEAAIEKSEAKKKEKSDLVINLAAMPEVEQPSKQPQAPREKVQKPDIALPQDAIKKAREGSTAPLEQFTKKDKVKKKGRGGKTADFVR